MWSQVVLLFVAARASRGTAVVTAAREAGEAGERRRRKRGRRRCTGASKAALAPASSTH
jgi:hypothetical protein